MSEGPAAHQNKEKGVQDMEAVEEKERTKNKEKPKPREKGQHKTKDNASLFMCVRPPLPPFPSLRHTFTLQQQKYTTCKFKAAITKRSSHKAK